MTTIILLFILWRVYVKFPEFLNNGKKGTKSTPPITRYIFLAYAAVVVFQASAGALVFTQKGLGGTFQGVLIAGAVIFVIYRFKKTSGITVPKFSVSGIMPQRSKAVDSFPMVQQKLPMASPKVLAIKPTAPASASPVQRMHKLPTDGRIKPGWFS